VYVQVFRANKNEEAGFHDDFKLEEALEHDGDTVQQSIDRFLLGRANDSELKELKFIMNAGLPRDIAKDIDPQTRSKLERMFPILQKYQCLCFKQRPTTMRRMLIFPSKKNYRKYMEDMKKLMDEINGKRNEKLNSRVMVRFRGKYIVKVDKLVYEIFKSQIESKISEYSLSSSKNYQINFVDITLFSSEDEMKKLQTCVNEIMKLLTTDEFKIPTKLQEYDMYPITSKVGREFIEYINSYKPYVGKIYLRYEEKTKRLLINGCEDIKEEAVDFMTKW
jgi:hypothetical protein